MDPFPQEHDLISLFECEPILGEAGVPWFYNEITFTTRRGNDLLVCEMEPAHDTFGVIWSSDGVPLVSLDVKRVSGMEAEFSPASDALIVHFRDRNLLPLRLQLKPTIAVFWGTDCRLP